MVTKNVNHNSYWLQTKTQCRNSSSFCPRVFYDCLHPHGWMPKHVAALPNVFISYLIIVQLLVGVCVCVCLCVCVCIYIYIYIYIYGNFKSAIIIRNTARLSCKLTTVLLMGWRVVDRWYYDARMQHGGPACNMHQIGTAFFHPFF
jgi:hypothetical protein